MSERSNQRTGVGPCMNGGKPFCYHDQGVKEAAKPRKPMSNGSLTPYSKLDAVLEEHAKSMQRVLGTEFVGEYLQGSLAIGDFDLTSDVDFIVVTREDLSEREVVEVQATHRRMYDQDNLWVKRLEYSFFPTPVLQQPSSPYTDAGVPAQSEELWYFDNGSPTIQRSDHDNTLVVRWTVREMGVTVLGPNPATLIDPVPADELRKEIGNTLVGWGQELLQDPGRYKNRFYQSYLVLNFCRMLHDLSEGKVSSKLAGLKWAKSNLDPQWIPLIDYCWKERQDTSIFTHQPADHAIYQQTLQFVGYAVERAKDYEIPGS